MPMKYRPEREGSADFAADVCRELSRDAVSGRRCLRQLGLLPLTLGGIRYGADEVDRLASGVAYWSRSAPGVAPPFRMRSEFGMLCSRRGLCDPEILSLPA